MRSLIQQHHPPLSRSSLPGPRTCHVHDLVIAQALCTCDRERSRSGVDRQDASFRPRRILGVAERDEQDRADGDPPDVERPGAAKHVDMIRTVTRGEIEEKLVAIIQQEKNLSAELIKPETPLAEAGIDSLDSLTILFAIEEQFRISIPDDRARAITTFGDLINIVQELLPAA